MANRARDVIKTIRRNYSKDDIKTERIEQYQRELKEATEFFEGEKEKSEAQKTHERYRRKQQDTEEGMSLEELIRPAKKFVEKINEIDNINFGISKKYIITNNWAWIKIPYKLNKIPKLKCASA